MAQLKLFFVKNLLHLKHSNWMLVYTTLIYCIMLGYTIMNEDPVPAPSPKPINLNELRESFAADLMIVIPWQYNDHVKSLNLTVGQYRTILFMSDLEEEFRNCQGRCYAIQFSSRYKFTLMTNFMQPSTKKRFINDVQYYNYEAPYIHNGLLLLQHLLSSVDYEIEMVPMEAPANVGVHFYRFCEIFALMFFTLLLASFHLPRMAEKDIKVCTNIYTVKKMLTVFFCRNYLDRSVYSMRLPSSLYVFASICPY